MAAGTPGKPAPPWGANHDPINAFPMLHRRTADVVGRIRTGRRYREARAVTVGTKKFYHAPEALALAYELRSDGIRWRLLERYLGRGIRDAVERAKRNGLSKNLQQIRRG